MNNLLKAFLLSSVVLSAATVNGQSKTVASTKAKQTRNTAAEVAEAEKPTSEAIAATVPSDNLLDIAVSDNSTTYIVFGGPVSLVDIGQANNYLVKIEANAVFVRAKKKNPEATPILIRHGSKYWMGRLVYVSSPVLQLYDFQNGMSGTSVGTRSYGAAANMLGMDRTEANQEIVDANLEKLRNEKEEYQSVSVIDNELVLSLANVRNDKDFTYMRFKVINKSNIDYEVDFTDFQLVENSRRRFLGKKKNESRRPLDSSGGAGNQQIEGRTTGYLTYAVPLYAATERGYLEVTLREVNGARVLVLAIPSKVINHALDI